MTWVEPPASACALKNDRLVVVAGATKKVKSVTFTDDGRARRRRQDRADGVYSVAWSTKTLKKGKRHLVAIVTDAAGHKAAAARQIKICK